ncbi:DUF6471 domain-containing protein [Sphingomonas lacusdianchii]|uniref:DUF6471 domain-containing protein n=1 Tax=Sphingomonas lacusdianchii TaxID=2917992 RepID=UPI001F58DF05|nr:DUF6471 domain-containing protein [Sphingomonas sp. JXJ CY 53]
MNDEAWERQAKNMVRAELMRRGLSQERLVQHLSALGIEESVPNLRKKLSRGRFTAVFFLQLMAAIGVEWLQIPEAPGTPGGDEAAGEFGAQALARSDRAVAGEGRPPREGRAKRSG